MAHHSGSALHFVDEKQVRLGLIAKSERCFKNNFKVIAKSRKAVYKRLEN